MGFTTEKKAADFEHTPKAFTECVSGLERLPVGVMDGETKEESRNSGNI